MSEINVGDTTRLHDNDLPLLGEGEKAEWDVFLTRFKRDALPIFERHGFHRDVALVVFELNRVESLLVAVQEALAEEE